MRSWLQGLVLAATAVSLLSMACGGSSNKPKTPTPAATSANAVSTQTGGIAGTAGTPSSTPTTQRVATPSAGTASSSAACSAFTAGPQPPAPAVAPTSAATIDASNAPSRPPIDVSALTVSPQLVSPFTPAIDGRINPTDLAKSTADPPAALARLNSIGFLGGRQQGFTGPTNQGRIPTLFVQHLVFNADPGASDFLRNPLVAAQICLRPENAPQIGQETQGFFYQFNVALPTGGQGPADGHSILWRCGRVVIGVTGAGAPGQTTQGQLYDLAQKIQAQFVQSGQPCS